MQKNISNGVDKAKASPAVQDMGARIDDVKDSMSAISDDVRKVKEDAAGLVSSVASTVRGSKDYVQDRIETVKQDAVGRVSAIKDTPIKDVFLVVLAACFVSYLLGRRA
jgi:hypothetical protein